MNRNHEAPIWMGSMDRECAAVDVRTMYPEEGDERAEAIARSICADCVFIEPCREYAIKYKEAGVWGETTEKQRQTIDRKRHRNAATRNT